MLNLTDKSVSDIISSNKYNVTYVATSGKKLYYTGYYTHAVTCCDLHGTTQWELILSIRRDNHNVVRRMTDDIHVPIIVYRYTTWTSKNPFIFEFPLGCTM
jgi:hypothetical protein